MLTLCSVPSEDGADVDQAGNDFGQIRSDGPIPAGLGPISTCFGWIRPNLSGFCQFSTMFFPILIKFGRFWPTSDRFRPNLSDSVQIWADVEQIWADFDQLRADFGLFWPMSAYFGLSRHNFGRCRPALHADDDHVWTFCGAAYW